MPSSPKPSTSAPRSAPPDRAWQRMLSGRRLDLLDPSPMDIEIEDIAHGLARVARWNGQTQGNHAFSVAQHCVIVADICAVLEPKMPPAHRLVALLHDAPEYVIGDMISPFKAALGIDYRQFEDRLEAAIHVRFGLPARTPAKLKKTIKRADLACAFFEATQLAGFSVHEAKKLFKAPPEGVLADISPLSTSQAQQVFLDRFASLLHDMDTSGAGES